MRKKLIKNEFQHDCAQPVPFKGEHFRRGYMTGFQDGKIAVLQDILAQAESMSTARDIRHLIKEYLLSK